MTAPIPPHADDPSWDLVSAYVDGVAAPDEAAMVEADPALMAQVESMRLVSRSLAAPRSPAPEVKEAHLNAALAEFEALFADTAASTTDTPTSVTATRATSVPHDVSNVRSLKAARAKRRPRRLNMVAAAAAAIAVLFAGVVAVGLNAGNESFDMVTAASDAVDDTARIKSSSADVMGDSDDALDDSAMDEEDAMEDDEPVTTAMRAESTMDDESANIADDALEDAEAAFAGSNDDETLETFTDDADEAGDAEDGTALSPGAEFLGEFDQIEMLDGALRQTLTGPDLQLQALELAPTLSPTACPDTIAVLTGLAQPTLLGRAIFTGNAVELHASNLGDVLIVSPETCTMIDTIVAS